MSATLLTLVVPAYNSAPYLHRCIDSLLGEDRVEVVIVNDGSTDDTAAIADAYAFAHPQVVRVIHQVNAGHGGAVNAGIAAARGEYVKVVDSDDWLNRDALRALLSTIVEQESRGVRIDAFITNFVKEREGARHCPATRYTNVMPQGRPFGWSEVGAFRTRQHLMMHAVCFRTEVIRASGLQLPEHTFYVDNLFVFVPLIHTRTVYYLNVDLYRYFIGRDDQSVAHDVMIRRSDQHVKVTRLLLDAMPARGSVDTQLFSYLIHHLEVVCAITSIVLLHAGGRENLATRTALWNDIRAKDAWLHARLRRSLVGTTSNLPGSAGRKISVAAYHIARRVVGFS
ncbi:glycosyltransferase family 2 protein [Jonesia denitrificans]|uniref:Glycosyl transferase family 2 n=1 Tax=Jonesia denitrificans (strain ATCC 14870 / DSM 20603 / BCRC 15368 / CIP 55.134 / JCM 11481 / NBRC 15587 / NCTC 10816 / Prevot 55134) TaxID=471856 RepID=C7R3M3_JONDD|nr:glycosyltransferase family 2 protein [Jonesia denitrificans]ACV10168.1 glycosyl transferase family 2 [Jonesia denitrificans DSM 20603]ASE08612.1 glycosyltransferase family 2 protein [Jonesia denitrificans]QXB43219.1 glycosyltransferase [Jonesia denitrificans]SQH23097.1 Hyaluronan synthase [Jonesia denitrificans]